MLPSEWTTRCHGSFSCVVARMRPTRRGALGSMSPWVPTKPAGVARPGPTMRAVRASRPPLVSGIASISCVDQAADRAALGRRRSGPLLLEHLADLADARGVLRLLIGGSQ